MLYLVATPIGNLADITLRAIETLKRCDYVLCEDTRHSRILLEHHEIDVPLKSFHRFNEAARERSILQDLKEGLSIGLVSDAGMPLVCDPGARIVRACRKEGIRVTAVPGPSALLTAFALSGWEAESVQFVGFLPKNTQQLQKLLSYPGITIGYESPNRLCKTLRTLPEETLVGVARELTKFYEEFREGTAKELITHYTSHHPLKGEIVLLIRGIQNNPIDETTLCSLVKTKMQHDKKTLSEAVRLVAQEHGYSRSRLYKMALTSIQSERDD